MLRGFITVVGLTLIATQATATSCTTSEGVRGPDVVPEVTQAETELADVEGAVAVEVSLVQHGCYEMGPLWSALMLMFGPLSLESKVTEEKNVKI